MKKMQNEVKVNNVCLNIQSLNSVIPPQFDLSNIIVTKLDSGSSGTNV